MNFWIKLWTILLFGGLGLFICMALTVAIGGFFNVLSLFKKLLAEAAHPDESPGEKADD